MNGISLLIMQISAKVTKPQVFYTPAILKTATSYLSRHLLVRATNIRSPCPLNSGSRTWLHTKISWRTLQKHSCLSPIKSGSLWLGPNTNSLLKASLVILTHSQLAEPLIHKDKRLESLEVYNICLSWMLWLFPLFLGPGQGTLHWRCL